MGLFIFHLGLIFQVPVIMALCCAKYFSTLTPKTRLKRNPFITELMGPADRVTNRLILNLNIIEFTVNKTCQQGTCMGLKCGSWSWFKLPSQKKSFLNWGWNTGQHSENASAIHYPDLYALSTACIELQLCRATFPSCNLQVLGRKCLRISASTRVFQRFASSKFQTSCSFHNDSRMQCGLVTSLQDTVTPREEYVFTVCCNSLVFVTTKIIFYI